jgi:hypothetical protein
MPLAALVHMPDIKTPQWASLQKIYPALAALNTTSIQTHFHCCRMLSLTTFGSWVW